MDLNGKLGLKEWILEALTPVASVENPELQEYLFAGVHPKPSAPAPQIASITKPPETQKPREKAAPGACNTKEEAVSHTANILQLLKSDPSYSNALSVTNTALQMAKAAAKNAEKCVFSKSFDAKFEQRPTKIQSDCRRLRSGAYPNLA
jgi:hypothetical protein